MGMRFTPDEPTGRPEPGLPARVWRSLRGDAHDQVPPVYASPGLTTTGAVQTAASPRGGRLTAAEVTAVRFRTTKMREGYDQSEVDDFLDRVEADLRERAVGRPGSLTPADVVRTTFQPSRLRPGYVQSDVDDFLDRVMEALG